VPEYLGIARDDKSDLLSRLMRGLESDVTVLTGGVSMGEYDFVKEVFKEAGLEIIFSRVAMKPGKPTVFARRGDKMVFGLPGNPVSSYIAFENIARLAIGRLCGMKYPGLPRVRGVLLRHLNQVPGRTAFLPARATIRETGWTVDPLKWKGSADIVGFSRANAAAVFPADRDYMPKGETIEAMLFPDYFSRLNQEL
jgi:molybdopterin molybdotransferase